MGILRFFLLPLFISISTVAQADPAFRVSWRLEISSAELFQYGPQEMAAPALTEDGSRVVVGTSSGALHVVSTVSGETEYSVELSGGVSSRPAVDAERLIVGTDDGYVYLLNLRDGSQLWEKPGKVRGAIRSTPVAWGDYIFVQDDASVVHALKAADGELTASYGGQSFARRGLSPFTIYGFPDLLLADGALYAGFETGYVARFGLPTGGRELAELVPEWEVGPCAPGKLARVAGKRALCSARRTFRDADSTPVMTPSGLLTGCHCRGILLLDPANGKKKWETAVLGPSGSVVSGERAAFASADGSLYGLDLATGRVAWTSQLDGGLVTQPVLLGGTGDGVSGVVLLSSGKSLYAVLLADGSLAAKFIWSGGASAPPAVAGDAIFLLSNEGYLYRIDYFR